MQKKTVSDVKEKVLTKTSAVASAALEQGKKAEEKVVTAAKEQGKKVEEKVTTAAKEQGKKVGEFATETKETAKKAIKKTTAKAAVKASSVKKGVEADVYIQYANQEALEKDIVERAKAAYVEEGHKASSIKSIRIYIKPEDNAAYYVINKNSAGRVNLF